MRVFPVLLCAFALSTPLLAGAAPRPLGIPGTGAVSGPASSGTESACDEICAKAGSCGFDPGGECVERCLDRFRWADGAIADGCAACYGSHSCTALFPDDPDSQSACASCSGNLREAGRAACLPIGNIADDCLVHRHSDYDCASCAPNDEDPTWCRCCDSGNPALDPTYVEILTTEFGFVESGDGYGWDDIQPASREEWDFGNLDALADLAEENRMGLHLFVGPYWRGHPKWIDETSARSAGGPDPELVKSALESYVRTTIHRYKGRVEGYTIQNEVIAEIPGLLGDEEGLRKSGYWELFGPDYVRWPFFWAREEDPKAELCIREINADEVNAKSDALYDLVVALRGEGVPLDCVELQMHIVPTADLESIRENMRRFRALGLSLRVGEFDVNLKWYRLLLGEEEAFRKQRETYGGVVASCLEVGCSAVNIFGITDRYTWLRFQDPIWGGGEDTFPLPWDEEYRKKPAYYGVLDALQAGDACRGRAGGGDGCGALRAQDAANPAWPAPAGLLALALALKIVAGRRARGKRR